MKIGYGTPLRPGAGPRRGFALLVTIVLVAFLVLILVGLATFTRVETQVADNSQQLAAARQNALMALNLALGRLQETTGPDQRVTATADLQPRSSVSSLNDGASGENLSGLASGAGNPLDKIDAYWGASRNRHWVGAWANGNPNAFAVNTPATFNPEPQLQGWLVSGNETIADKYKPTDVVPGFIYSAVNAPGAATTFFTDTPADPDAATARTYRLLVGKTTAGIVAASDLDRAVAAPQIPIRSDSVPGISGSQVVGHYAWWVGDEGVKAKATVIDAYSTSPSGEDNRTRLQSAQRPVIEAININLESVYKPNDPVLGSLLSFDQYGFISGNVADLQNTYRPRFHDLTIYSQGVLSDTKRGGLKGDFSKILGQSNDVAARDDLRAVLDNALLSLSDNILTEETTVYATPPGSFTGSDYGLGLVYTPTWAQLRSYFNMGNTTAQTPAGVMTDTTGSVAQSRIQTRTTQGITPTLVQVKLFFGLDVDSTNVVSLKVRPLVVLANPYNIDLKGSWWIRLNKPDLQLRTGDFEPATPPPSYPESGDTAKFPNTANLQGFSDKTKNYLNRLNLVFKNVTIPPGRAVIFCLDKDYSDPGGSASPLELELVPGFDELHTFSWRTSTTLAGATPPAVRYVALYTGQSRLEVRLYGSDPSTNTNVEDNLVTAVFAQPAAADGACFLVPPISTGSADGGGTWFVLRDSLRTDVANLERQMSPFIQFNNRALYNLNAGYGGTANHVLEPARTYTQKNASTAPAAFKNDLLMDASGDTARWGPVTKGAVGAPTTAPAGVGADTGFKNILYDLPRPDRPIISFGQLQHFNPAGFIKDGKVGGTSDDGKGFTVTANTYQLNYPAGNSYANPWMPRDLVLNAEGKAGIQYDGSWLFNEALADRFFFSSYPGSGGNTPATYKFLNARLRLRDKTVSEADFLGGPRSPAKNLLLDGAFNINSTSVEAWKAILSATRKVPVGGKPLPAKPSVSFARTLYQPEDYAGARDGAGKEAWAGFSSLTNKVDAPVDDEIDKLAREIVLQIHRRGPFLSLADFYNRRLILKADDPAAFKLGVSGAIQSAIDAILNQTADVNATFQVQSNTGSLADSDYLMRTMTAGAPGYLLQGDVLSTLAPSLAARSDTFVIRAYGDSHNPATGQTSGQAWCEAVVQRLPDYIVKKSAGGNDPEEIPAANSTNGKFGRRYQIVSFRWLGPDDI